MHSIAESHLYTSLCPIPISTNAIWSKERHPSHLPPADELHNKVYKMSAENLIQARYRRFLENSPMTPNTPLTGVDPTEKDWSSAHVQSVSLPRGVTQLCATPKSI